MGYLDRIFVKKEKCLIATKIIMFSGATLKASDMRSCLFMLSEECKLRDLTLYCTEVNTVIVMQAGTLHINNCMLRDDSENFQVFLV